MGNRTSVFTIVFDDIDDSFFDARNFFCLKVGSSSMVVTSVNTLLATAARQRTKIVSTPSEILAEMVAPRPFTALRNAARSYLPAPEMSASLYISSTARLRAVCPAWISIERYATTVSAPLAEMVAKEAPGVSVIVRVILRC